MTEEEVYLNVAEYYLKEFGSMKHYDFVAIELINAIIEFENGDDDDSLEEAYSFKSISSSIFN